MVAGTDPGCVCSLATITHCLPMLMFAELQFCVSSDVHILFACKELPGDILESNAPSHNMQNTNGMTGVHNRVLSIKRRASALYWPSDNKSARAALLLSAQTWRLKACGSNKRSPWGVN